MTQCNCIIQGIFQLIFTFKGIGGGKSLMPDVPLWWCESNTVDWEGNWDVFWEGDSGVLFLDINYDKY